MARPGFFCRCYPRRITPTEEDYVAGRCIALLWRDYYDHERAWLHCRPAGCSGFGFLKLCRGQIDSVRCRVYAHCSCSLGRFYGLDDLEFSRRCFAGYRERSVAAAGEGVTRVDLGGIDACPDGEV